MVTAPHPLSLLDRAELFVGSVLALIVISAGLWARWQKEKDDGK